MCYADESRPAATDLRSSIIRARSVFSDLTFYYEHEMVYGFWRYSSDDELVKLTELYKNAVSLCDKYLEDKVSVTCLITQLDELNLDTEEIKKFVTLQDRENGGKI